MGTAAAAEVACTALCTGAGAASHPPAPQHVVLPETSVLNGCRTVSECEALLVPGTVHVTSVSGGLPGALGGGVEIGPKEHPGGDRAAFSCSRWSHALSAWRPEPA